MVERRAKKIAAAVAAVSVMLGEEEAARVRARDERAPTGISPWSLAGRLALMSVRLAGGYGRNR